MGLGKLLLSALFIFFQGGVFSQDYFSYGAGNFSGLQEVTINPAAAADNRLRLDVIAAGASFNYNNSWFEIKREALKYENGSFPTSWKNQTPNVPDNFYKNFMPIKTEASKSLMVDTRFLLPSALWQINEKNGMAFSWNLRQMGNVAGISQQFAFLFENELDLGITQNNRVQNKRLTAVQMTWAEYGLTYARVLTDKNEHFLKAGATPKLLQGIEAGYLIIEDLDFFLSTTDTNSYFNTKFSSGHSDNFEGPGKGGNSITDFYKYVSKPALGLDIGFIYEWRPNFEQYKYPVAGNKTAWYRDKNKYRIKFGASLVDVGRIKYTKAGRYYDLDIKVRRDNVTKFFSLSDINGLDSLLKSDFAGKDSGKDFAVMLPTALNTQVDVALNSYFYLNLSTHLTNFGKNNPYRVHNYSAICFAPRFEHYWFDLSVPISYNTLSADRLKYLSTGLNLRIGPLSVGSSNLVPLFKGDVAALNVYAVLKLSIPHKKIRDRDGDGVFDKNDECPDEAGLPPLRGCPDADGDNIADVKDGCPHQPGIALFRGCPDADGDSIADAEDRCPLEKGKLALKGCPDKDNDGITDKEDLCPSEAGLLEYKGCPDPDNDRLPNNMDDCPEQAGPAENKGCPWPDTDKDGVIDKLDSCVTVAGALAYNGCPAPAKLAPAEKIIIQKAVSNLEFESGKDVIKPVSYAALNALGKLLVAHSSDWKIKLSGHTDNVGTPESNMLLSEMRTMAVKRYLVKKLVKEENFITEWYGQSKPIADNTSKEGKRKNRRVEMFILLSESN